MTRVLLTGFEPFGGDTVNPSWDVAQLIAKNPPDGLDVTAVRLSCVFGLAATELRAAIEGAAPDIVLSLGQASGRPDITVERVAINIDDARIPDNAGRQPIDRPIIDGGADAHFARLPVKACVAAIRESGVPASLSHTAGTFVCNHVFYALMHLIATERPTLRGGFVHLPALPEQVLSGGTPSMSVDTMVRGVGALLVAAAGQVEDVHTVEGTTH
ncbi:MAG TPA: pyroglutamyl-peptidase I [Actinospica sp.]|nr:pyroglutamyl-peptidase I [Actinospica sp.]